MKFFRRHDIITVAALIGLWSGDVWAITASVMWFVWLTYMFVDDYDETQTQLRRLAKDDPVPCSCGRGCQFHLRSHPESQYNALEAKGRIE